MEQILGEFATEEVKRLTLLQLETSMKEEQAAIDAYRRRADYARRGYPAIAIMLDHIRGEEEEHLREISREVNRLKK